MCDLSQTDGWKFAFVYILIRRNNDEKIPLITLEYDLRYIYSGSGF